MNHSEMRKFLKSLFFQSSDLGFRSKKVFFLQFMVDPLDLDPGRQNLLSTAFNPARSAFLKAANSRNNILITAPHNHFEG